LPLLGIQTTRFTETRFAELLAKRRATRRGLDGGGRDLSNALQSRDFRSNDPTRRERDVSGEAVENSTACRIPGRLRSVLNH